VGAGARLDDEGVERRLEGSESERGKATRGEGKEGTGGGKGKVDPDAEVEADVDGAVELRMGESWGDSRGVGGNDGWDERWGQSRM
jgi:hypothetical protein